MPTFCQVCAQRSHRWFLSKFHYLLIPVFFTLTACGTGTVAQNTAYITPTLTPPVTVVWAKAATPAVTVNPIAVTVSETTIRKAASNKVTTPAKIQPVAEVKLNFKSDPLRPSDSLSKGLISLVECTAGLTGQLLTSRAGEIFLYDHGITTEDPLMHAESAFINPAGLTPGSVVMSAPNTAHSAETLERIMTTPQPATAPNGLTQSLLTQAYSQSGRPFKVGGQSPGAGFDASGYTSWVYAQKGVKLPRSVRDQAKNGRQVIREELRPGDLLIYRDSSKPDNEFHVGIYTGQGNFLHTSSKTEIVTETAAFGPQFAPYFVSGRRYFDDPKATPLSETQKMAATSTAVKLALAQLGPNDKLKRPKIKARRQSKAN